jgi:hypothetical protein
LELRFGGERLQDTEEIICYEPGIQISKPSSASNKVVKAQAKIAVDCALGEHHLRLRTASGVSELRTFFVGPFPVIEEKEPNNEPAKAQKISLNSTVEGVIANEDVDCFAVELKKGQRFSVEVEGMRLGRAMFDPWLAVLDASGAVLSKVDDTWLGVQDPFLSMIVPKDGNYVVQLRESTYGGSDKSYYRLHIGTFPRPTAISPMGGRAGDTVAFKFFSEATGEFARVVKLPASPQDKYGVFAEFEGLWAPTPNWVRVSPFPNVLASTPNQDREHATFTDAQPPLALNGVLEKPGQEDWFRFPAVKDKQLEVAVYARRLRSPLDSVLQIYDADGKSVASDEDGAGGADSSLKFTPNRTTNYYARIQDTLGHGGRDFTYRIEIVPSEPRLTVKIPEVARNDSQSRQYIPVPRGNRVATLVSAKRANFTGQLVFGCDELPSGMTLSADSMPRNNEAMPLVFEAAPDAPIGGRLVDLTATGTNSDGKVVGHYEQNVELVQGPNNTGYYNTSVERIYAAVVREAPFKVRIVEPKVPLVQSGSMPLEIVAERSEGFDEPIHLEMVWNPPGVNSQSEATIAKGATNVFYQLNANGGAETRTWKIAVQAHAKVNEGSLYVSSQLANLEVATPFLSGKIETLWAKPGETAELTVNLQQSKPFDGKAKVRLLGLPEKVAVEEKEISKDDSTVTFSLKIDPKCSTGSSKNLFCAVDVKQNGATIPHTIAQGGILRITPKKEGAHVATVSDKKK